VSHLIARYRPSRRYAMLTILALVATGVFVWVSAEWGTAWLIAAGLLGLTAILTLLLTMRPPIEIFDTYIRIGQREVLWSEIRQLDRISIMNRGPWIAPLLLRLTMAGEEEIMVFHPGDADSCISLLRHIYRYSRSALLDGVPYREFWGEQPPVSAPLSLPRPRLLLPEDEEEVERLFQRLKVAGRLDGADET
jgi:hypothetical protein